MPLPPSATLPDTGISGRSDSVQPFNTFIVGILRKWWWLVTGIIGGVLFIPNLLGINPDVSRTVGLVVLVVCFL